jgi:Ca2+-binding RTX toxin-like protein
VVVDSRFERLGAGNDLLTARPQSLMEVRGPDGDVLDADGGDDTLRGESSFVLGGADTLSGGEGSDAFRINSTGGTLGQAVVDPAIITDFSHEDSLELRLGQLSGNTELTLTPIEDGTGTLVQIDGVTHAILQSATVVELGQIKLISDNVLGECIVGTEGNVTLFSSGGTDSILGKGGDDVLYAYVDGTGSATLAGGDGNDTLSDGLYGDILFGGNGHDPITGSESPGGEFFPDTIFGDYGVDTINDGENTLVTGGEGDGVFKVTRSFSSMIITYFVPGVDIISYSEQFAGTSTDLPFSIHEITGGSELLERVAVNRLYILRP